MTAAVVKVTEKKEKTATTKTKKAEEGDKQRGRAQGTWNFTGMDMLALVRVVGAKKPLGLHGWGAVAKEYNEWAKNNDLAVRDRTSLRHKFDAVCIYLCLAV